MSMYEVEALIENTVRVIDQSDEPSNQKRNLIWNAYHIQSYFDCSFTHFRLMDILLKNEYVQTFKLKDYPLYSQYPDFFEGLLIKKFGWIQENPVEKWSRSNQAVAYWDKKTSKIYVDYGSRFYTLFPGESHEKIEPLDFGLQMVERAHQQKNKGHIYDWTVFMVSYLLTMMPTGDSLESLKQRYFSAIKHMLGQYNYDNYLPLRPQMDLRNTEGDEWLSDTQKALLSFLRED